MLAQAIARISPTIASNTYKGFEYRRRNVSRPVAPSLMSSSGRFSRSPIVGRGGRNPLVKHRTQRGLRLRQAHARTQARHHFEPVVVLLEISLGVVRSSSKPQQEVGAQRNIEIRAPPRDRRRKIPAARLPLR